MSRYIPVRQTMDSEDHYHSPYDTHDVESDAHYEAPTCLKRNPSGSLFIPSGTCLLTLTLDIEMSFASLFTFSIFSLPF